MRAEELAKTQGSKDSEPSDRSISQFLEAVAALEESWSNKARHASHFPFVTWTPDGPRLGASTLLAREGAGEEARLLALLSIAHGFPFPSSALKHLSWAEPEFERRNLAKSAMHVALTGLPAVTGTDAARRLHIAAGILDSHFLTPVGLLKACEMDSGAVEALVKAYNPDEPRIPAGNTGGGRWTSDDTGGPSRTADRGSSDGLGLVLPEGCEEEWAWALQHCAKLLRMPNPPRSLTGGHTTIEGCAKGFVSERCGGNPVA
jgi:hypothetical protein